MKPRKIVVRIVTLTLFGLLIISFVVWGIGDIIRNPGGGGRAVAEIGDSAIGQQEFQRTLTRELNRFSARFGGRLEIEQARALGLVDQVLAQMIGRALFDRKARDLGLIVTQDQLVRQIQQEPAFQNAQGAFDRDRFVQTLQASNLGEQEYLEILRHDILRQQIARAVSAAAAAPRDLAEQLYRYREERRTARVLTVPNTAMTDIPEPDQAALEAFHEEAAAEFMAPEQRTVSVVELRPEHLAKETRVPEADVRDEFEARRDDFVTPERRALEQIVLQDEQKAQAAAERLAEGEDFAAVAQELTGAPPVELGAVEREDLPDELQEPVFALPENTVSEPLQSPLGWHLLRVTEVTPRVEQDFEEVREEIEQDIAMRLAVDSMISIANQLDDALAGGASLEEAAESLDLQVRQIGPIDREGRKGGEPVEDLPPDPFLETAFNTEPNSESLLTETTEGGYFVVRVDEVEQTHLRPLEEVREQVLEKWREARREERARETAEALAERARGGTSLEKLAAETGYELTTTEPLSRFDGDSSRSPASALAGKLFEIAPGEVTAVDAPEAHLVAELVEIVSADPAANPAEVQAVQDGLEAALQGDILEQYARSLRDDYGVEINQRAVDDLLATF